jgi:hypothetical protein
VASWAESTKLMHLGAELADIKAC